MAAVVRNRRGLPAIGRTVRPVRSPAAVQLLPAPRLVVKPKPAASPAKKSDTITLFVQDVISSMERVTTQPAVMMTGILAVVLILSHLGAPETSIVDSWITYVNTTQPNLAAWLTANENWLYGLIAFIPGVLSVPDSKRVMVMVATLAWILLLPHRHPWEYLIQSAALRAFFTTSRASTRSILVLVVGLFYWLGLMTFT